MKNDVIDPRTKSIREWWTTPSSDGFTPREYFVYGGKCVLGAAGCFALMGFAAWAVGWALNSLLNK